MFKGLEYLSQGAQSFKLAGDESLFMGDWQVSHFLILG